MDPQPIPVWHPSIEWALCGHHPLHHPLGLLLVGSLEVICIWKPFVSLRFCSWLGDPRVSHKATCHRSTGRAWNPSGITKAGRCLYPVWAAGLEICFIQIIFFILYSLLKWTFFPLILQTLSHSRADGRLFVKLTVLGVLLLFVARFIW